MNSKSIEIPKHLADDSHLSAVDVLYYCKIKSCFDTRKEWKKYPVELLFIDCNVDLDTFMQSIKILENRGFLFLDEAANTVSLTQNMQIYSRHGKNKSLYIGRFDNGVCKVGITDKPTRREKQLSQYGIVFTMERIYTFEDRGLSGHLESLIKKKIPMLKLKIPGGTECFEEKYFEKSMEIVDGFLSSVYCGEVSVVQKEREVGSL